MEKRLPDFLGIGAHKAGTTWLFERLRNHPDVWMPIEKEVHFFDRSPRYPSPNTLATASPLRRLLGSEPWERSQMAGGLKSVGRHVRGAEFREAFWLSRWLFAHYDEDWYRRLFLTGMTCSSRGEITPSYALLDSDDVARIKMMNPDMKLIFMIRNPIERAWSAVRFNVDRGHNTTLDLDSDDEIIAMLQRPGMVLRGDYERTLEVYLKHFDSKQILVCFYDAISQDKAGLMAAVTRFLDIEPVPDGAIDNQRRVNASPPRRMSGKTREFLCAAYGPMIGRLARRYGSYARRWESAADADRPAAADRGKAPPPAFHP